MGPHVERYMITPSDPRIRAAIRRALASDQHHVVNLLDVRSLKLSHSTQQSAVMTFSVPEVNVPETEALKNVRKAIENENLKEAADDPNLPFVAWLAEESGVSVSYIYHYGWKGLEHEYCVGIGVNLYLYFNED